MSTKPTKPKRSKLRKQHESYKWAAKFHDKLVFCEGLLGYARAIVHAGYGAVIVEDGEHNTVHVFWQDRKKIKLADLTDEVVSRMKGEKPVERRPGGLTSQELTSAIKYVQEKEKK